MILKLFKQKKNSYFVSYYYKKKKLYQIKLNYFEIFFFFLFKYEPALRFNVRAMLHGRRRNSQLGNSQQYAVRSVTIQPFDIQFSPNAVECLPTCTGMLHCCIGHLVPILEKPTSPHTPIHMHRHPETHLGFLLDSLSLSLPPAPLCAASNQFSFQNEIQACLLLFIELQNRRKD